MASHAGDGGGSLADWFSTAEAQNGGVFLLRAEQHFVGGVGSRRRGLRADRFAGVPVFDEPSRVQENFPGPVNTGPFAGDVTLFHAARKTHRKAITVPVFTSFYSGLGLSCSGLPTR